MRYLYYLSFSLQTRKAIAVKIIDSNFFRDMSLKILYLILTFIYVKNSDK